MKPIIIYDDRCELCNNLVEYLKRKSVNAEHSALWVGQKEFLSKHRDFFIAKCDLGEEQLDKSVHFIDTNGKVYKELDAIQKILQINNIYTNIGSIKSNWLLFLLNLFYRLIARIRKNVLIRKLFVYFINKL